MSAPPAKLSASLLVRKEDVPEEVRPPQPASAGGARMTVSYRPSHDLYTRLRGAAFEGGTKMQHIIDEALEEWFARNRKT